MQNVGSKNTSTYSKNIISQNNSVNIVYSNFNGTFGPQKSFSFKYPSGWKAIDVNQLTQSEIASFGLNGSSVTVNVYLSCNNNINDKGRNITLYGYTGVESINSKSVNFYAKNFNIVLVSQSADKMQIFDYILNSLKLYNKFSTSNCS